MAEEIDDLEIQIEEDPKGSGADEIQVVKAEETPKSAEKRIIEPEEGLEALKQKLENERQARLAETARANAAQEREVQAKNETQDTQLDFLKGTIEALTQGKVHLKAQLAAAHANQDYEAIAELQDQLSTANAKLVQLEQGKIQLEQAPKQQVQRHQSADPVEAFLSRQNITGRSADWIRQHPQFATDARLTQKMVGAHNMVMADGYVVDSPEYFSAIENTLSLNPRQQTQDEPTSSAATPIARRSAPPAAPVTRGSNGNGSSPNIVRLTAAQREMAQMMQMSDKEYAVELLRLQKEGLMN